MEWERTKSILLALFVLLNAALGGLRFAEFRRHWMTEEQERNIRAVLSMHNIHLYAHPDRRFAPMRTIDVGGFYYDEDFLAGVFFGDGGARRAEESGAVVFVSDSGYLEISNGFVFFENLLLEGPGGEADRDFAQELTGEFIRRHFPGFEHDIMFPDAGGVRRIYREVHGGLMVYSNFIEFLVTEEGISQVEMQFGRVLGESQMPPRTIIPPDEALLTFMQRFSRDTVEDPIFIHRMDMVYVALYRSDEPGSLSPAAPFYRIFVEGNFFPLLINAFTNELAY